MPHISTFSFKSPDGFIGSTIWNYKEKTVILPKWRLNQVLKNGVLYINNIYARPMLDEEIDNYNYNNDVSIKSAKLSASSNDDIEVLFNPISINLNITRTNLVPLMKFTETKVPLFKINDLKKEQNFNILFTIDFIDTDGNNHKEEIIYNFRYDLCSKKGDVNGDGYVDLLDVVELSDHIYQNKDIAYPKAVSNADLYDLLELIDMVLDGD